MLDAHIEITPGVTGGQPWIAGRRITVQPIPDEAKLLIIGEGGARPRDKGARLRISEPGAEIREPCVGPREARSGLHEFS
ncbi:MAG: DUF433 domain-containing protein [Acidobacteria bacterium]|nr:DUF433 domain-containing protein [Acidobacteriota bacterium]